MKQAFDRFLSFAYGALHAISKLAVAVLIMSGAARAETVTVAALGDSLTAGYGLPQGDGFVPQLEAWLQARGADAVLVNAGVSGDTTAGGLSRAAWTLTPEVDAMIVTLGGNDYLRALDPSVSRANLEGILSTGQEVGVQILLVGMTVGSNYGADYKQEFESIYPELAEKYGVLFYPDFWAGLRNSAGADLGAYMQPDGLHPNKDGVAAIVEDIGPSIFELIQAAR